MAFIVVSQIIIYFIFKVHLHEKINEIYGTAVTSLQQRGYEATLQTADATVNIRFRILIGLNLYSFSMT